MQLRYWLIAILLLVLIVSFFLLFLKRSKPKKKLSGKALKLLENHVAFYRKLEKGEKQRFRSDLETFLSEVTISGIGTEVEEIDRILVASSAVIPLFGFPGWMYTKLKEVLLYPGHFDHDFRSSGKDRRILGMVGDGYMSRTMILSRPALRRCFSSKSSKSHVGIHEFVHLLDKADGATDGVPELFMDKKYIHPWLDLIRKEIRDIKDDESDINVYGATSPSEFFPVATEYFFKRPELLENKHPKLYEMMELIFHQDLTPDQNQS